MKLEKHDGIKYKAVKCQYDKEGQRGFWNGFGL